MSVTKKNQEALDYHSQGRPGKIEVVPTKPYSSQRDLSLAYSPGVAEPCLEIAAVMTDMNANSTRLRQSSPFAGILSASERKRIYEAFRT